MMIQFAFFTSYAILAAPAGALVARLGYFRAIVMGFALMAVACLLFTPAAGSGVFAAFLGALFILGGGITLLQVAVNPLITSLGAPRSMHSRLTFAQFFNSLGVFLMIRFGAQIILGDSATSDPDGLSGGALRQFRISQSLVISQAYLGIAAVLAVLAIAFWIARRAMPADAAHDVSFAQSLGLLRQRRLAFGVACIFLYVGAEVGIASMMVNYLEQKSVLAVDAKTAGVLLSDYWLGAMIGRLCGGFLLRFAAPGKLLAAFAGVAVVLVMVSFAASGSTAAYSLIAVGLANSIMFPTIFSLAVEGLGERAPQGSGLLCTAIVGGAVIPELIGRVADASSLRIALLLPAACYLLIAAYGWSARRPIDPPGLTAGGPSP
jgi:FHS family L-fucose permease-like MFS transporter